MSYTMTKTKIKNNKDRGSEDGFVLLSAAAALILLLGMCGLAVDVGRMYITKNEAQAYADSAALDAATKLDGTATGIQNATAAVTGSVNTWQFNTTSFTRTTVEFSQDGLTGWDSSPSNPANYGYVRVTATARNLGLFFLPVVGTPQQMNIAALAVAGQILTSGFTANTNNGVFPFSPIAHADGVTSSQVLANDPSGNFGFTAGQFYDMRWASNPKLTGKANVCPGDATNQWVTKADASNNSERGYIEETSASAIRAAIEDDGLTLPVVLNQQVTMTGGAKGTEADALAARIAQDTDPTSNPYSAYMNAQNGNGRRVVTMAINSGPRDNSGVYRPAAQQNVVVGFAQFFLTAMTYPKAGNQAWCAEYIGPGALVISQSNSGASTNGANGAYVVRLTQ
ncbi:MAG TPA: Tad domain-containing protein [Bryobacteraceae bacterium]|nr:Tad domain-containing protein [Bryobacteraceae bacterium]